MPNMAEDPRIVNLYISNPVTIAAVQWDGTMAHAGALISWIALNDGEAHYVESNETEHRQHPEIRIKTLEGVMSTNPADWIIRGTIGEFYPCKPEVFARKYHPVFKPETSDAEDDGRDMNPKAPAWEATQGSITPES